MTRRSPSTPPDGSMPQRILQRVTRALLCLFLSTLTAFLSPAHAATPIVTYYHLDALGSPLAATDAQGNLLWKETYTAYGDRLQNAMAANTNTRWYTGHPDDSEVGLSYFGARWYDASLGRFMGVDPKDFSPGNLHSFNRYNYGNNNPYKYVDPDGEYGILAAAIWVASVALIYYDLRRPPVLDQHHDSGIDPVAYPMGPWGTGGKAAGKAVGEVREMAKGVKDLKPTLKQESPHNLIPTQTRSEITGSQVKKLTKSMEKDGFDQSQLVDVWRNPNTGRLEIQDGHHRTEAAKKAGLDKIPVRIWE